MHQLNKMTLNKVKHTKGGDIFKQQRLVILNIAQEHSDQYTHKNSLQQAARKEKSIYYNLLNQFSSRNCYIQVWSNLKLIYISSVNHIQIMLLLQIASTLPIKLMHSLQKKQNNTKWASRGSCTCLSENPHFILHSSNCSWRQSWHDRSTITIDSVAQVWLRLQK